MKTYSLIFTVVLCLWAKTSVAQDHCSDCLTPKDSVVTNSWVVGIGMNVVDDSATPFGWDFIKIKESWNSVPYPSRISVGRFLGNGIGIEAIGTYNRYKAGKLVDGSINPALREYFAIDGKISYDLNKLVGETGWFDPYLHTGAGYSSIGNLGRATANAGFGFNTWFNEKWGLNFNTMGKWGIKEGATKQLQHSAAVVHRFGVEKELSRKGAEKMARMQEMEKQIERVADSIQLAKKLEEEKLALEEELSKRIEDEKLAAAEKARLEEENSRRELLKDALSNVGKVYFALNSSYLNQDSKNVLDKLVDFLEANPSINIGVGSHTDSRGTSEYNKWLSERRAKRTLDYLLKKGIVPARLETNAQGEEKLSNHCEDGVHCTEEEHRANRRSEFVITSF